MDWISVLMQKTGAFAKDCLLDEAQGRIIFLVSKSDVGRVIGRRGETIRQLRQTFGKEIEVVEYSDDLEQFARNTIAPVSVQKFNVTDKGDKKTVVLTVDAKDKGRAIGKEGRVLKRSRLLLQRHFGVDNVVVTN